MTTLFINIKELIQVRDKSVEKVSGKDMSILPTIKNAFMMIEDEIIINFGPMEKLGNTKADTIIDVTGKLISNFKGDFQKYYKFDSHSYKYCL